MVTGSSTSGSIEEQASQAAFHSSGSAVEKTLMVEQSTRLLGVFSGSSKPGSNEVDFKHWSRAAVRISEDEDINETHKRRILLQSLQGEAADAVDLIQVNTSADIIDTLNKVYGTVTDGRDLLLKFYQHYQQRDQSASQYLAQLFLSLGDVINSGSLNKDQVPQTILTQFIRGIDDEDLLTKLRLEERLEAPPDVPDLLQLVRQEETRRQERRTRHEQKVESQVLTAETETSPVPPESPKCNRAGLCSIFLRRNTDVTAA
jgi:hypothetical protein